MASFDFIEASSKALEFVWDKKAYLARVAVPVVYVKVACLLMVFVMHAQDANLLIGLITAPGVVLEALFVVGVLRFYLYNESIFIWGKVIPVPEGRENVKPYRGPLTRLKSIQSAIAIYLLIKVILTALMGATLDFGNVVEANRAAAVGPSPETGDPTLAVFFIVALFIALVVWAFRFMWLFIPPTMGLSVRAVLNHIRGIESSVFMVAAWMTCVIPVGMLMVMSLGMGVAIFGEKTPATIVLSAVLQSGFEVIILAVSAIAMTYGFREMIYGKPEEK